MIYKPSIKYMFKEAREVAFSRRLSAISLTIKPFGALAATFREIVSLGFSHRGLSTPIADG